MRFSNKVVVVTGGGNGIGREVVLEMLHRGAKVAAVDLRKDSLNETAELADAGDRLATFAVDITDRDAVDSLPAQVAEALGEPDILINVAGIIQPFVRIVDLDYDVIERVIDVNLYGTLHTVKAFLPRLLQRPAAQVVNVSSMGGFLPVPGQGVYGASKAAVSLLTEALYSELLDTPVGVTLVYPGAVGTDITANSGVDRPGAKDDPPEAEASAKQQTLSPQEAARLIVEGVAADKLHVFVGRDSRVMNLLTRTAPRRAARMIQRKMRHLLG